MSNKRINAIKTKFADERSGNIILLSHCLLNENTRYFGGAFQRNFSKEILEQIHTKGYGIIQLPCPEQKAWGGLQKPYLWLGIDNKKTIIYPFRHLIYRFFILHTKRIYSKIANKTVKEIRDQMKAGYTVKGIIGIGGSPTCGVQTSLDISRINEFANLKLNQLDRKSWNDLIYTKFLQNKAGLFMKILQKKLRRRKTDLVFYEFDLQKEMNNEKQILL